MQSYTDLIKALLSASTVSTAWEKLMLDAAAAIEALQAEVPKRGEIVRCGECDHRYDGDCPLQIDHGEMPDNWFCADGERKEAEHE